MSINTDMPLLQQPGRTFSTHSHNEEKYQQVLIYSIVLQDHKFQQIN